MLNINIKQDSKLFQKFLHKNKIYSPEKFSKNDMGLNLAYSQNILQSLSNEIFKSQNKYFQNNRIDSPTSKKEEKGSPRFQKEEIQVKQNKTNENFNNNKNQLKKVQSVKSIQSNSPNKFDLESYTEQEFQKQKQVSLFYEENFNEKQKQILSLEKMIQSFKEREIQNQIDYDQMTQQYEKQLNEERLIINQLKVQNEEKLSMHRDKFSKQRVEEALYNKEKQLGELYVFIQLQKQYQDIYVNHQQLQDEVAQQQKKYEISHFENQSLRQQCHNYEFQIMEFKNKLITQQDHMEQLQIDNLNVKSNFIYLDSYQNLEQEFHRLRAENSGLNQKIQMNEHNDQILRQDAMHAYKQQNQELFQVQQQNQILQNQLMSIQTIAPSFQPSYGRALENAQPQIQEQYNEQQKEESNIYSDNFDRLDKQSKLKLIEKALLKDNQLKTQIDGEIQKTEGSKRKSPYQQKRIEELEDQKNQISKLISKHKLALRELNAF